MCVTCRIHYILICYHMRKCTHGRRAVKIISLEAVFDRDGMPFSVGGHIIFHWICTLFCCASFGCGYIDSFWLQQLTWVDSNALVRLQYKDSTSGYRNCHYKSRRLKDWKEGKASSYWDRPLFYLLNRALLCGKWQFLLEWFCFWWSPRLRTPHVSRCW